MINRFVLFFILIFFNFNAFSQKCFEYHKTGCIPSKSKFIYSKNNASVSFEFAFGEKRVIPVTLLMGKDYRITLCGDDIFDGVIQFIIRNTDGKILYDNSSCDYKLNIEFSNKVTQRVLFELIAPELNFKIADSVETTGCIGILIEDMVSVKTGF